MKKWRTIILCVAVALVLLIGGLLFAAQQFLNSEGFQKQLLSEMSQRLQCQIRLNQMKIRIHRGADLVDIRVASDNFRPRDFMKAERLRLRYDLYEALFHRKVVLEELKFSTPEVEVDLSAPIPSTAPSLPRKGMSQPALQAATSAFPSSPSSPAKSPVPKASTSSDSKTLHWPAPPSIDLRSFVVEDGSLKIMLPEHERLWIRKGQVRAVFTSDPTPSGTGSILCESVDLPAKIQLARSKIDFLWREDSVTVPRYAADLLGGSVDGNFKVDQISNDMPFDLHVRLTDLSFYELLLLILSPEAMTQRGEVVGQLNGEIHFQGDLQHPAMVRAQGQLNLKRARLIDFPALRILGGYLNHPEFRDLSLQKCQLDFLLQSGQLQIPHFEMRSSDLQLDGKGWIRLSDKTQEFEMKLWIGRRLLANTPEKDLEGLTRRSDGSVDVPFRVWGTTSHLQSDLTERFARLAARAYGGAIFDKIFESVPAKTEAR